MKREKEKNVKTGKTMRKGAGVTFKLASAIIVSVVILVSALLELVYIQMSSAMLEKSSDLIQTTTGKTIQETRSWMNRTLTMLEMQRDTIEYENMDIRSMKRYIRHTAGQNEAYPTGLYVALADGSLYHSSFVPGPDYDALSKKWYQDGIQSEDFILGDTYIDEDSQAYVVGASGILKDADGGVRGVAAADVSLNSISDIVSGIKLEETGGIFLVDTRTDTIIGHHNQEMTGKELVNTGNSMYDYVAEQIKKGNRELSVYNDTYIQVADVPGCDWAAVAYVSRTEVLHELIELTKYMSEVMLFSIILLILLVVFLVKRIIGRPVKELSHVATQIAEGRLEQEIHYHSRDELGVLAHNFNQVTIRLRGYIKYINEISEKLMDIASGNLAFTLESDYDGEFEKIKTSLEKISYSLNNIIGQLNNTSLEVAAGAEQISNGAMALSQGSIEQAASVETLAGHISLMSGSVSETARNAQAASNISQEVRNSLLESNNKMQHMTTVIQKACDKSSEIHHIVRTIEDIAFQTNILALNASEEASRAGDAGKGFAVVAGEVRMLAAKSSEAAQETSNLLGETVISMEEGMNEAKSATNSILELVEQASEMDGLVCHIADNTKKQAGDAAEIKLGIEQISSVVQTNASTAEKSAAASEELSGQAEMLKNMVGRFKLKN
ncbi:MAG: methyl-accepting chemotaxis protein [Lachnospiraceae bacterium]|nr:methyl-accepting chemotaxis protein [Lachnospiraceae bacterium]